MLTSKGTLPVQREKVSTMPSKTTEPSDNDGDEKGFMKLRFRKGGRGKKKS